MTPNYPESRRAIQVICLPACELGRAETAEAGRVRTDPEAFAVVPWFHAKGEISEGVVEGLNNPRHTLHGRRTGDSIHYRKGDWRTVCVSCSILQSFLPQREEGVFSDWHQFSFVGSARTFPMRPANSRPIKLSDKETLEWSSYDQYEQHASPQDLERLAHWLDSVFKIPGIGLRFGIDPLLGLLPGVGDTASALASVYILKAATRFGVSRITIARMTLNIIVDLLVGVIPIVGDIFDVYWKANRKNVELLRRHLKANPIVERKLKRSDGLFVAGMIASIGAILIASVTGAYFILAWAFESLSRLASG